MMMVLCYSKKFWLCKQLLLLILFVFYIGVPVIEASNASKEYFSEKLTPVGKEIKGVTAYAQSIAVSSDFAHLAYVSKKDKKMFVTTDGTPEAMWDKVVAGTPVFSPSLNRVAYIAADWRTAYVVVDGKVGPAFHKIWEVRFSPDGKHLAYPAVIRDKEIEKVYLVINHKKGPEFEGIRQVKFSPDSLHLAYIAFSKGKWHVIRDGKKGPGFDLVDSLVYSPDSKHLSYIAQDQNLKFVMLNGQKQKISGTDIGMTTFSPDSSKFAYAVFRNNNWDIIVDGNIRASVENAILFKFSPDSKQFAFNGGNPQEGIHIFVDGVRSPLYAKCSEPYFSPDSSSLAYFASEDDTIWYMVVGKTKHEKYHLVFPPLFSPDSSHMAYRVKIEENKMQMILNEKGGKIYENVGSPMFSDIGNRIAYAVNDKDKWFMVIDGQEGKPFDGLGTGAFSPDGKHSAYTASKEEGKMVFVVDGREGKTVFTSRLLKAGIYFTSPNTFQTLIIKMDGDLPAYYRYEAVINN